MLTITLLGTAATMPLPDRALSAAFAACGGHGLLWDCGEGTQAAARRAGVNLMRADAICLTHYHATTSWSAGLLQTLGRRAAQGRLRCWVRRPAGYLGGGAGTDRPAALSGEAAGAYAGPAAGAGCAERGLACRCAAGAVCHKAPGKNLATGWSCPVQANFRRSRPGRWGCRCSNGSCCRKGRALPWRAERCSLRRCWAPRARG